MNWLPIKLRSSAATRGAGYPHSTPALMAVTASEAT